MLELSPFLDRLGLAGDALPPTGETVERLQQAHLLTVPFENLDVVWKRPIRLDEALLFEKIVGEGRGGFCYELNGLMAAMLRALGFEAHLMAASVAKAEGGYGPAAAHACIRVALDPPLLMEVGFGDSTMRPMILRPDVVQHDGRAAYRLLRSGDVWELQHQAGADGLWRDGYRFTEEAWSLGDFQAMCDYQQTSPESNFTKRTICSKATETGRVTLTGDRLILTEGDRRRETPLGDELRFEICLWKIFGIVMPEPAAASGE
jgi:N-hydroxyarylamine O-acetyltransferase